METTRTRVAVIAMVASVSLLAACSDRDDAAAPMNTTPPAEAPAPAPAPPPAVAPETTPTPAPDRAAPPTSGSGMGPGSGSGTTAPTETPPPSSGMAPPAEPSAGERMKESAKIAANTVAVKAVELKDSASRKAGEVGEAIKEGAAKADDAIQHSLADARAHTPNEVAKSPPAR